MKISHILITAFAILIVAALSADQAFAQSYRFSVPELRVVVTVQKDASAIIEYRFVFANAENAHPIDVVDVGMPKRGYKVLSAQIDGKPLKDWRASKYIEIGPEIHLSGKAIPPGERGVFECKAQVPEMVYSDTTDDALASLRFTPTWFGSQYVQGETDLLLVVKFPEGVSPDDVVWHDDKKPFFQKGIMDPDGMAFVSWTDQYSLTRANMFGCSFPRSAVDRVVKTSMWKLLVEWWKNSPDIQVFSGIIFIVLFMVFFLLMTRGTGIVAILLLDACLIFFFYKYPLVHLCAWLFMPAWIALWYFAVFRRRQNYLPAIISVEGGRICRGLSAPEAAILLELPLNRVLSMIIFGMLQKGVLIILAEDPFTVRAVGTQDKDQKRLITLPDGSQVTLQLYEILFWKRLGGVVGAVRGIRFDDELKAVITMVRSKVTGFDVKETKKYYREVVARTWRQVKAEVDLDRKSRVADEQFSWLYMSDNYDDDWDYEYRRGWRYHPRWWHVHHGHYNPHRTVTHNAPTLPSSLSPTAGSSKTGAPSFKDVAASFVGRIEKVGNACVSSVDGFHSRTGIQTPGLNLSGIDRFTMDTLSAMASNSGGMSGGGGGGCACACAGCACACACAGGGR